jgi:hypothetical protein
MPRNTPRQGQKQGQGNRDVAPRVRLGSGEFVPVGAANPHARMLYLQAVSRCVPKAITDLMSFDVTDDARLREWAERYSFTDPWALDTARHHAPFWRENPDMQGHWGIVTVAAWVPTYDQLPPPAWNPLWD